jgi:citrate synthase
MNEQRLSAQEAAARLGVKVETLYAYVSRGLLTSERAAEGRTSTFSAGDVEAVAARRRRGGRAGGLEVIVASRLTSIEDGRLSYRGLDATELAGDVPFEAVAEWLWTGDRDVLRHRPRWPAAAPAVVFPGADAVNRLRVVVATAAAADPLRYDVATDAVMRAGRRMITAMVDGLPVLGTEPARVGPFPLAGRLWPRLGAFRATPRLVSTLNAALVLLADHELAASTFAARMAASVRADPYSVVSTGLGCIAGALHGAASQPVVDLFAEVGTPERAARVVGERLRRGERIPGLGHKVYRTCDPRAVVLLDLLRHQAVPKGRWSVVERVLSVVEDELAVVVNIDYALGALAWVTEMDGDATEAVFSIARTAGWLAHAIEEYAEEPLRFRPRAAYIGLS